MMLLHRSGADLKMKDMNGSTVAHMAASTNSVQSLRAIHECFGDAGVLSTQSHNGSTPAHIAAVFDNVEVTPSPYQMLLLVMLVIDVNQFSRRSSSSRHPDVS